MSNENEQRWKEEIKAIYWHVVGLSGEYIEGATDGYLAACKKRQEEYETYESAHDTILLSRNAEIGSLKEEVARLRSDFIKSDDLVESLRDLLNER